MQRKKAMFCKAHAAAAMDRDLRDARDMKREVRAQVEQMADAHADTDKSNSDRFRRK